MSDNEHFAIGLNRKGFMYFVILFIIFFPIAFMPWMSKELRAKPAEGEKEGAIGKVAKFFIGFCVMSCIAGVAMMIAGKDPAEFGREMDAMDAKIDKEMAAKTDYRHGYKAGYNYTNPSGKVLTDESMGNFQGRLEQMNKSMGNADAGVESLANDYGGNKSKAWKDGCKEGYLDGLRNAKSKY